MGDLSNIDARFVAAAREFLGNLGNLDRPPTVAELAAAMQLQFLAGAEDLAQRSGTALESLHIDWARVESVGPERGRGAFAETLSMALVRIRSICTAAIETAAAAGAPEGDRDAQTFRLAVEQWRSAPRTKRELVLVSLLERVLDAAKLRQHVESMIGPGALSESYGETEYAYSHAHAVLRAGEAEGR